MTASKTLKDITDDEIYEAVVENSSYSSAMNSLGISSGAATRRFKARMVTQDLIGSFEIRAGEPDKLLTTSEAADRYGKTKDAIYTLKSRGKLIPYLLADGSYGYLMSEVDYARGKYSKGPKHVPSIECSEPVQEEKPFSVRVSTGGSKREERIEVAKGLLIKSLEAGGGKVSFSKVKGIVKSESTTLHYLEEAAAYFNVRRGVKKKVGGKMLGCWEATEESATRIQEWTKDHSSNAVVSVPPMSVDSPITKVKSALKGIDTLRKVVISERISLRTAELKGLEQVFRRLKK